MTTIKNQNMTSDLIIKNKHWKTLQNPRFIGSYTLIEMGVKELEVTITSVAREMVKNGSGDEEEATICYLDGQKELWLNITNQKTISRVLKSPLVNDWIGKTITLYVEKIKDDQASPLASIEDMWIDALRVREFETRDLAEVLSEKHPKYENICKALSAKIVTIENLKSKYTFDHKVEKTLKSFIPKP